MWSNYYCNTIPITCSTASLELGANNERIMSKNSCTQIMHSLHLNYTDSKVSVFLWDRGSVWAVFRSSVVYEVPGEVRGCSGRGFESETAEVEVRSGRV